MTERVVDTAERQRGDDAPNPLRWRILGVSLVVGFMSLLDASIVNVALPSLQKGLHTSQGTIQWVVSGYMLTFGLTLVAGGRLGDAYGRRRMMTVGLIAFTVTSAAVGFAPNAAAVVTARLAQGASAGLLTPQNSGLIQQLFRGPERGRAFGLFGFTVSVSSATGPVIGGLILALAGPEHGWRYLFLLNVPIGLVALYFVARLVPGRTSDAGDVRIDVVGAVLVGALVIAVLYPVVSIESEQYAALVLLALAPPLGWAFVSWERRTIAAGRPPLLDISLLSQVRGYAGGLAIGTVYFTGFTGLLLVISFHAQVALGYGPLQAGLLIAPFAVGSALSAEAAGRIVARVGRLLTVVALATVVVGIGAVAVLIPGRGGVTLWVLAVPLLFLTGVGGGAVVSPNLTLTLADVPPRMGGAAGGALQTGQRLGSSVGAALLMTVYAVATTHIGAAPAVRLAFVTAFVVMAAALAMAVRDWRTTPR